MPTGALSKKGKGVNGIKGEPNIFLHVVLLGNPDWHNDQAQTGTIKHCFALASTLTGVGH